MPVNTSTNTKACLLPHRGVLRVGGEGRLDFLQGLLSNDIVLCTSDHPLYAALLTPQGKYLHDLFLFDAGDSFLVDSEAARLEELLQKFTAYKLRAKVTLENVSEKFEVRAIFEDEPEASPSRKREGLGVGQDVGGSSKNSEDFEGKQPPRPPSIPPASGRELLTSIDPRQPALGTRGIFEKGAFRDAGAALYDAHRLALGVTEDRDMLVGKSSLLDGNFDFLNGISWSKGCYVGQELTARMHHRGLAKKRLFPVKIEGVAPSFGAILHHDGNEIGEMRSANATHGLALLNIDMAKALLAAGAAIVFENTKLSPFQPDWMKI